MDQNRRFRLRAAALLDVAQDLKAASQASDAYKRDLLDAAEEVLADLRSLVPVPVTKTQAETWLRENGMVLLDEMDPAPIPTHPRMQAILNKLLAGEQC